MSIASVARVAVTVPSLVHRATAARRVTPVVRGKVALRSNDLDLDALVRAEVARLLEGQRRG